ncbi:MAG: acetate--CoA ligase family protein [Dehalococcoidia bacterium]
MPSKTGTPAGNAVIERARKEGRTLLSEVEAKQVLAEAGIPVVEARLAPSGDEASSIADELGYPVALKIISPQITHKSDIGGVKLGLDSPEAVAQAYAEIIAAAKRAEPGATIDGVSVQRMAEPGIEVIVGMTTDPQFGPVLMFGLGGILVEVLKDVAFRVVPITERDAAQMIRDIQGFPVLEGYRGHEPADLAALEELVVKLSAFVNERPEISELDLNPVFAYPTGAVAVDARIVLTGSGA